MSTRLTLARSSSSLVTENLWVHSGLFYTGGAQAVRAYCFPAIVTLDLRFATDKTSAQCGTGPHRYRRAESGSHPRT